MYEPNEKLPPTQVPFNSELLKVLNSLDKILKAKGLTPLNIQGNNCMLVSGETILATISSTDIRVLGQSFEQKVVPERSNPQVTPRINQRIVPFLDKIADQIIRLNHLGLSYGCTNPEDEISLLRAQATDTRIPLHREISDSPDSTWLFLGDTAHWQQPLFEIVLNNIQPDDTPQFPPHFQIDLDTTLTIKEIKAVTHQFLGPDFVSWQLDIPDYGTVLAMGSLGKIGNTEILLGLGTDKRGTEFHRKEGLKPI